MSYYYIIKIKFSSHLMRDNNRQLLPYFFFLLVFLLLLFVACFIATLALEDLSPPPPILNIFVSQTVHVPDIAPLPFFIVTCFSFFMSLFALHFTQYACVAITFIITTICYVLNLT